MASRPESRFEKTVVTPSPVYHGSDCPELQVPAETCQGLAEPRVRGALSSLDSATPSLLFGYQIAYLILSLIGCQVRKPTRHCFPSRSRLSVIWLALHALNLCLKSKHRRVWLRHTCPALSL